MTLGETGVAVRDVLASKYRVERIIGAGGMGMVVAVHHLHLDQQFAVKLMLPDMLGSEEAVARFVREARAAAKIKSDHVVRVFDVDSLANGAPYLVRSSVARNGVPPCPPIPDRIPFPPPCPARRPGRPPSF